VYLSKVNQDHRISAISNRADQSEICLIHGGDAAAAAAAAGGDRRLFVAANKHWFAK